MSTTFKAKKSLGQNWLVNPQPLQTIIEAARLTPGETVLEVGPGTGILTAALLKQGARVVAVEKDERLVELLKEKFAAEITTDQLELIGEDILDFKLPTTSYKLIANIPYYLTGQLLRKFLSAEHQPSLAVLMLQKEVAQRIVERTRESLLSISVKVYGQPKYLTTVKAGNFSPAPKVDSAILLIDKISKNNFQTVAEKKFFTLLKQGFGSKRKMLKNNLNLGSEIFRQCKIEPNARAENLSLEQWLCLAKL